MVQLCIQVDGMERVVGGGAWLGGLMIICTGWSDAWSFGFL